MPPLETACYRLEVKQGHLSAAPVNTNSHSQPYPVEFISSVHVKGSDILPMTCYTPVIRRLIVLARCLLHKDNLSSLVIQCGFFIITDIICLPFYTDAVCLHSTQIQSACILNRYSLLAFYTDAVCSLLHLFYTVILHRYNLLLHRYNDLLLHRYINLLLHRYNLLALLYIDTICILLLFFSSSQPTHPSQWTSCPNC